MKRAVLGWFVFAAISLLAFKLFEPVFVWKLGWKELPAQFPAAADSERVGRPHAALDAALAAAREQLDAPSMSAAILVADEVVWAGAAGFSDLDAMIPATTQTVYRLGSTSKAVTSVAAGVLIDEGAIDLDAPLSQYMPDLSAPLAGVSVRQAMSHTGGVRNYGLCLCFPVWEHLNARHYSGPQRDTLRSFEASPLLFEPGSGFAYTSLGYNALGGVIEAAGERPFTEHLQTRVFAPLRMRRTFLEDGAPRDDAAVFYEVEEGRYKKAFPVDNSNKFPSGGILSTPSDMVRLGGAMTGETLFTLATRDLLVDPQELSDGTPNVQGYALGWRVNNAAKALGGSVITKRYSHHGTAQGSTSYFAVYPRERVAISVMMNKGQMSLDEMSEAVEPLIDIAFAGLAAPDSADAR